MVKVLDKNIEDGCYKKGGHLTWDEYFMSVAFLSGQRSKDPVTQVGACIVNTDNKIVGVGYNGMPIGCHDNQMPWNKEKESGDWVKSKSPYVCHAEMNAIINRFTADLTGCKLYSSLYPCNECTKLIVQSGIKEVIYASDKYHNREPWIASKKIMEMVGMKVRQFKPSKPIEINFNDIEDIPTAGGN